MDLNSVFDSLGKTYECSEAEIKDLMKQDIVTSVSIENTHFPLIVFTIKSNEEID
jgi:hypothetical protein